MRLIQLGTRYAESSNRAVMVEELTELEWDDLMAQNQLPPPPNGTEYSNEERFAAQRALNRALIGACVKKVTTDPVKWKPSADEAVEAAKKKRSPPVTKAALALPPAAWFECDPRLLELPGPKSIDSLFTDKDRQVLINNLRRLHIVSSDDLEAMLGEMQAVSGG